jgi:formylglycine-generating enzyme required for sulfatase activity
MGETVTSYRYSSGILGLVVVVMTTHALAQAPGSNFKDCPECPEMVVIPTGNFMMGSAIPKKDPFSNTNPVDPPGDEQPQHGVTIARPFAMGKFEVTQEQWFAVMGNNPSDNKGRSLPVESISWNDAQVFVQRLGAKTGKSYRLPTEAEWEYAARAGSTTLYSFGDDAGQLGQYAWYGRNSGGKTHPVGEKQANKFGLFDMHGNVSELIQDCYDSGGYVGAPTDGRAVEGNFPCARVTRGGSWGGITASGKSGTPDILRSAARDRTDRAFGVDSTGLRVVRTLQ